MVVLAPLLDLAEFYRRPFRIATEASIAIELEDEGIVIRGRIDVLVVNHFLWLVVIESKRSDFAVNRAIPQTLAHMLSNPKYNPKYNPKQNPKYNPEQNPEPACSTFGLITNGLDFLFLKTTPIATPQYATSRLFSLINPDNELYDVLAILKNLVRSLTT